MGNLVALCWSCHAKKYKLERRWLRGDWLALQEFRNFVGLTDSGPESPLSASATRLGPPIGDLDHAERGKAISKKKLAFYSQPGVREWWSELMKRQAISESWRAKVSASAIRQWNTPGMRERMSKAMKEAYAKRPYNAAALAAWKAMHPKLLRCEVCGSEFGYRRKKRRSCSLKCAGVLRWRDRSRLMVRDTKWARGEAFEET